MSNDECLNAFVSPENGAFVSQTNACSAKNNEVKYKKEENMGSHNFEK